ncbi:MHYT domain-containing protein [Gilvimarinus agarilyticus]|uniref:MHYT domain-containing protein n=1 Tax=Gilvimarinus agarilyticus TaxID=679259 RepID=UPI0005A2F1B2|nr:MHYT domain-containing protein [Gilvimarinus agarilyticus]
MLSDFFFTHHDPSLLLSGVYNYKLVALSVFTAVFAGYFTLHLLDLARLTPINKYRHIARGMAALIMAGGIWSMHFIGMLAFSLCRQIEYDPLVTLLSFIPAFVSCLYAIFLLSRDGSFKNLLIASVLLGAGIGTMHYSGMAAMELAPLLRYDPLMFALSIVVAVTLSFIGLLSRFYLHRVMPGLSSVQSRLIGAVVLGCGVSGMHYMGMVATRFIDTSAAAPRNALVQSDLSFIAISVACITIGLTLAVAVINGLLRFQLLLAEKTEQESRLSAILSTAVDGIVTIGEAGDILSANGAAEAILGYREEELIGQSALRLTDDHQEPLSVCPIGAVAVDLSGFVGRNKFVQTRHKDGHSVPIRLGVGEVRLSLRQRMYVAFLTDLTEQHKLQQELLEKERQYRSLVNNIPGVAFRCEATQQWPVIFASPSIQDLTGYNLSQFLKREITLADLVLSDDLPEIERSLQQAISRRASYSIEYRIRHRTGEVRWVWEQASHHLDGDDKPLWIDGVLMDITERHAYENQLKAAKQQAEQAAQSKQAFLANMSHEIRTPMNSIIGFSEVMLESELPDDQRKHLSTIHSSARSLMHLLNDILDSAKLEKGKVDIELEHFSLSALLDGVISTFWLLAKQKGIDLNLELDDDLAHVYVGDPNRIRQVLTNLLGNAVKFTDTGFVTARVTPAANNDILFEVIDTGIGIEADRAESIFQAFEQADSTTTRRFGGTGLGTTISKQLVELMGGRIGVTSEPNKGSHFYFSLPLQVGDEAELQRDTRRANVELPPLNILVADDIDTNIELLFLMLSRQGHRVISASNGEEAFQRYRNGQFDIVLMDVHMPICDGICATEKIRQHERENSLPKTPIIALTASVLQQDRATAYNAGMDGFANKPINVDQLYSEIGCALGLSDRQILPEENLGGGACIDFEHGELLWGSRDRQCREINTFLEKNRTSFKALEEPGVYQSDQNAKLLHTLKGVAGNLGLAQLARLLRLMEQASSEAEYEAFCRCLADNVNSIHELLELTENGDDVSTGSATAAVLTLDETVTILQRLNTLASTFETDVALLESLRAGANLTLRADIDRLMSAFDDFEFDQASAILTQLVKRVSTMIADMDPEKS